MRILVLGGTGFVGRHFVTAAITGGHHVTLFNRGHSQPGLFPGVPVILGDRGGDLGALRAGRFDAVVDTCGYFPANLDHVAAQLKESAGQYLFISSCSVYDMQEQPHDAVAENGQLVGLDIDAGRDDPATYGARKYLCEQVVRAAFPTRHLIVRPGLIVGPHDASYRFPYWADRIAEGGTVLAPGDPQAPLQFIDARDLAAWMLHGIEHRLCGTFNAVSPYGALTLGAFLQRVTQEINAQATLRWLPEDYLRQHQVDCWTTLPLWLHREWQAFQKIDSSLAIGHGLRFRPLETTVRDTHRWSRPLYNADFMARVLSRERETALLDGYRSGAAAA